MCVRRYLRGLTIRCTRCLNTRLATCTSTWTPRRRRYRRTSPSCMSSRSEFATGPVNIGRLALWKQCKRAFKKKCHLVGSVADRTVPPPPVETEPLPPELQPLIAADGDGGGEVNATDPIVQLFLKRQRRMKEVKKRREAGAMERLERFAVKKYYTIRRGWAPSSNHMGKHLVWL